MKFENVTHDDNDWKGTGTCFGDTVEIVYQLIDFHGADLSKIFVCHGICLLDDGSDLPYSHAWIEYEDMTLQFAVKRDGTEKKLIGTPKLNMYRRHKVRDITRYSIKSARRMQRKLGHLGPWEKRYWLLTADWRDSPKVEIKGGLMIMPVECQTQ